MLVYQRVLYIEGLGYNNFQRPSVLLDLKDDNFEGLSLAAVPCDHDDRRGRG